MGFVYALHIHDIYIYIHKCICMYMYIYMCICICIYMYLLIVGANTYMYLLLVTSHYCFMRFAYVLHMRRQNLVLFFCLYIEPFELVIKSSSTAAPRLPATKLICSNVNSGAATLSTTMMLLCCCSLASSSFTLRKS